MEENEISAKIIGSSIDVHRSLGPGLLESVYQKCLARELELQGVLYQEEVPLLAEYKGLTFEAACRMDMLVAGKVIVELKTVESILPVHEAQLLSYLRLSKLKLGLLVNFNVPVLRNGIRRIVNEL
ncbi:MAG: GxxExxY protein [Sulfuricaulis sp.]|nr:GxxExxY protein [Sulfuricaulis sp.]